MNLAELPTEVGPGMDLLELLAWRKVKAYNPWSDLKRRDGIDLRWHGPGTYGKWTDPVGLSYFDTLAISLGIGRTEAQTRCTLTHELIHMERGPFSDEAKEERTVVLLTAKRLVDPVLYRLVVERWPEPKGSIMAVLGVSHQTFRVYCKWRAGVTEKTAHRVWERSQVMPAWPPTWITETSEAARYVGLAAEIRRIVGPDA